jgi:hypothetical protein
VNKVTIEQMWAERGGAQAVLSGGRDRARLSCV